jgi:TetR/AcrR family transcriptional regulator, regulator of biofilm formation and stress response
MKKSRVELERHCEQSAARAIDAFIEGMTIHQSVDPHPDDRDGITRIIGGLIR